MNPIWQKAAKFDNNRQQRSAAVGQGSPLATEDSLAGADSNASVLVSVTPAVASADEDEPRRNEATSMPSGRRRLGLVCVVAVVAVALLLAGIALLVVWAVLYKGLLSRPWALIVGSALSGAGFLLATMAVCFCVLRARAADKQHVSENNSLQRSGQVQVQDIKHWLMPVWIPYGFGRNLRRVSVQPVPRHRRRSSVAVSIGSAGSLNTNPDEADADELDEEVRRAMATEMQRRATITSDIFDKSLRYSWLNRPALQVDRATPVGDRPQIRGEFQTEEDRILNLFKSKK